MKDINGSPLDQVPDKSLNGAFSRYVNDAYENQEFELPEPELVGPAEDYIDSEGRLGFVAIDRRIGDTAISELLLGGGYGNLTIDDGEDGGELMYIEHPQMDFVFDDEVTKAINKDGSLDVLPDDATMSLGELFDSDDADSLRKIVNDLPENPED